MFGFIKNLIAGILGFVTGLLPGKKKSNGYFLELDEAKSIKPLDTVKEVASNTQKEVETVPSIAAASSNGRKTATPAASQVAKIPAETTFAPKYLTPSATSSNGRRRPGANMTSFLEMARSVKTPG